MLLYAILFHSFICVVNVSAAVFFCWPAVGRFSTLFDFGFVRLNVGGFCLYVCMFLVESLHFGNGRHTHGVDDARYGTH